MDNCFAYNSASDKSEKLFPDNSIRLIVFVCKDELLYLPSMEFVFQRRMYVEVNVTSVLIVILFRYLLHVNAWALSFLAWYMHLNEKHRSGARFIGPNLHSWVQKCLTSYMIIKWERCMEQEKIIGRNYLSCTNYLLKFILPWYSTSVNMQTILCWKYSSLKML